jgi:hypothetical protein
VRDGKLADEADGRDEEACENEHAAFSDIVGPESKYKYTDHGRNIYLCMSDLFLYL